MYKKVSDIKKSVTAGSIIVFFKRLPNNGSKHGKYVAAKQRSHLLLGSPCLQSHDRRSAS